MLVHDLDGIGRAGHPQDEREGFARGLDQGIVPDGCGARGDLFDAAQKVIGADVEQGDGDDERHHLVNPGSGEKGEVESLYQVVHVGVRYGWMSASKRRRPEGF